MGSLFFSAQMTHVRLVFNSEAALDTVEELLSIGKIQFIDVFNTFLFLSPFLFPFLHPPFLCFKYYPFLFIASFFDVVF